MTKETKIKTGNWFSRHKVLTVIGGIVLFGIIVGAAGGDKSNTQTVPSSNAPTTKTESAEQPKKADTPAPEKMTISNSSYSESNGLKQVVGEIKNNDSVKHTATVKATFYSADGSIKGTAVGAVNDVAPGETKTFTLMTMDEVTGYANMKVQIDTLL